MKTIIAKIKNFFRVKPSLWYTIHKIIDNSTDIQYECEDATETVYVEDIFWINRTVVGIETTCFGSTPKYIYSSNTLTNIQASFFFDECKKRALDLKLQKRKDTK